MRPLTHCTDDDDDRDWSPNCSEEGDDTAETDEDVQNSVGESDLIEEEETEEAEEEEEEDVVLQDAQGWPDTLVEFYPDGMSEKQKTQSQELYTNFLDGQNNHLPTAKKEAEKIISLINLANSKKKWREKVKAVTKEVFALSRNRRKGRGSSATKCSAGSSSQTTKRKQFPLVPIIKAKAKKPFLPGIDFDEQEAQQPLPLPVPSFSTDITPMVLVGNPEWEFKVDLDPGKIVSPKWDSVPEVKSMVDGRQVAGDIFWGMFNKMWAKKDGGNTERIYMRAMRYYNKRNAAPSAEKDCYPFDFPYEMAVDSILEQITLCQNFAAIYPKLVPKEWKNLSGLCCRPPLTNIRIKPTPLSRKKITGKTQKKGKTANA